MSTQMKCGAVLIAVILVACLNSQPAFAQASAQLTEKGRVALVNRQFDIALSDLNKAIEADALNPYAHYYRGLVLGNLGRQREALDAFLKAAELNPGWGEAHRVAAIAALDTRNLSIAWEQAVKAYQAGADVSQSINRLLAIEKAPGDLDEQLAAARIFVMPVDTEKLEARQDNPFGGGNVVGAALDRGGTASAGSSNEIGNPSGSTSSSRQTNAGGQQAAQAQAHFYSLLTQLRLSLTNSRHFGVVGQQDMARYLMVVSIDEMGGAGGNAARGHLKLVDPRSGEEAYSRVLELRNIASLAELNAEVERIVNLLEEWLLDLSG